MGISASARVVKQRRRRLEEGVGVPVVGFANVVRTASAGLPVPLPVLVPVGRRRSCRGTISLAAFR